MQPVVIIGFFCSRWHREQTQIDREHREQLDAGKCAAVRRLCGQSLRRCSWGARQWLPGLFRVFPHRCRSANEPAPAPWPAVPAFGLGGVGWLRVGGCPQVRRLVPLGLVSGAPSAGKPSAKGIPRTAAHRRPARPAGRCPHGFKRCPGVHRRGQQVNSQGGRASQVQFKDGRGNDVEPR